MEDRPPDRRPAGTLRRLIAYVVLDGLIVGLAIFAAVALVGALFGPTLQFDEGATIRVVMDPGRAVLDAAIGIVIGATYFVAGWRRFGRTAGQALLGMRVIRAGDGARLGLGRAIVRWFALGAPVALLSPLARDVPMGGLSLTLLAAAWASILLVSTIADPSGRGLHDRLADSRVVRS